MNKFKINSIVDDLKELVKPFEKDQPYYRPFVCNGDQTNLDIFIVGINPATPIYEKDIKIDEYVKLLMRYDDFYEEYQKIREEAGKTKISRTRIGTVSFVNELKRRTGKTIMETNVIPFPTATIKLLKEIPDHVIKHAQEIFYRVLTEYTPKVIIVHSKMSLKYLVNTLDENKLIHLDEIDWQQAIVAIENKAPFIEFTYPDGKKGAIFACRHFMYYGKNGKSFEEFREKLIHYINGNNT
jgi:hypothetical protein